MPSPGGCTPGPIEPGQATYPCAAVQTSAVFSFAKRAKGSPRHAVLKLSIGPTRRAPGRAFRGLRRWLPLGGASVLVYSPVKSAQYLFHTNS
ncbi:hypothetical protein IG631_00926 [Alternaria alternata]|nr:hypothetical protein IG631_00926 [Alternaria alternata]